MIGILAKIAGIVLVVLALVVAVTGPSKTNKSGYEVRAIFDDAAFAVPGEDVRVSGAVVGSIQSLDVTPQRKAAVTLLVTDTRFAPFHANATCSIRPQSLIGEKYVDCNPGSSTYAALSTIKSGPGHGSALLPVDRTHSPIDSDIVQSIYRQPTREQFALVIDELGTGLAARGSDLNAVIHRADPALGYTDQVIQILSRQNRQLAQLASDGDTVLAPLARIKEQIQGFIRTANTTSSASASRAAAEQESIRLLPTFLAHLRPLMVQLQSFANQGTPVMASLAQSASALGRQFQNLAPFARAARPALISLGHYSQLSTPQLLGTEGLDTRLLRVGRESVVPATLLDRLLSSFDQTGGFEQLMSLLYYGTTASNGFDKLGHYLRSEPQTQGCPYSITPISNCVAAFGNSSSSSASAASVARIAVAQTASRRSSSTTGGAAVGVLTPVSPLAGARPSKTAADRSLPGLLRFLIGNAQ